MTEDEAKTKWCPQARQYAAHGSYNRTTGHDEVATNSLCLGSSCMAWRWKWERQNNRMVKVGGWCGLAGGPND